MENFESDLRILLVTYFARGYTPSFIAGVLQQKADLLSSFQEISEYHDAINQAVAETQRLQKKKVDL